jgi:hypothetical protein
MAFSTQQFCATWRQQIGTINPSEPDARLRLNTTYSAMVQELRAHYQATNFKTPCPSLDPERAKQASDPDRSVDELFELITHYPAEVTAHPVWDLLALAASRLTDEDGNEPSEEQLAPLAQLPNLWQHVRNQCPERHYHRLKLSYTAVLGAREHPFHRHTRLIRNLYGIEAEIDEAQEDILAGLTNELSYEESLQSVKDILESACFDDAALPEGLDRNLAESVLNALLPVYFFSDNQVLDLSLVHSLANVRDDLRACFLDAAPVSELLLSMSKTKLVENGICVDENTLYPDEVYRRLAKHRNSTPKSQVAQCLHAPLDVLEELSKSMSKEIIYPLASNPMTPLPILRDLLNWSGWGAKTATGYVKRNRAFLQGEAWQLMEMGRVMTAVDQRKRDVLVAILDLIEAHQSIAEALRLLLNAAVFAVWRLEPSVLRLHMIKEGSANHDLLMAAAWSWHWQERLAVARSPFAPQQALEKLCSDGLPFIQHAASQTRSHMITQQR